MNNPNLDNFIPDDEVIRDLADVLWERDTSAPIASSSPSGEVEIDKSWITVPKDAELKVLAKSYRQNNYDTGFGDHYVVLVAIGEVEELAAGIPHPKYCYATLFYSYERAFITIDFHSQMR